MMTRTRVQMLRTYIPMSVNFALLAGGERGKGRRGEKGERGGEGEMRGEKGRRGELNIRIHGT